MCSSWQTLAAAGASTASSPTQSTSQHAGALSLAGVTAKAAHVGSQRQRLATVLVHGGSQPVGRLICELYRHDNSYCWIRSSLTKPSWDDRLMAAYGYACRAQWHANVVLV
jgi:NADPH:quinone reductase-like Zn-dependent oxidoreductase